MGNSDRVKVVNMMKTVYKETFKEREIVIPSKGSVEMRRDEAVEFLGTISPGLVNGGFQPKNLEIEEIPGGAVVEIQCDLCGVKFENAAQLKAHIPLVHKEQLEEKKGR